jgi:VWFA-related protein
MVFTVPVGNYIRRLRFRASGYDASGTLLGEDEMVVNDPQPPFRGKLIARDIKPGDTAAEMSAVVTAPESTPVTAVDFFYGETSVGSDTQAPYAVQFNPAALPPATYVRMTARNAAGDEANDVFFFGDNARASVDVVLQRIPLSVVGKPPARPLTPADFKVNDSGMTVPVEAVVSASEEPLSVILLIDSSESMLQELPVVRQAAKDFARMLTHGRDAMAVVGFHERTFWLTPFTNDVAQIDKAVDRLRPLGRTHLYDASIEMLYELQKRPGRRALVVLTDGANDGGDFNLDQLIHYVRYSGVAVYPVIKNTMLSKMKRFGVGYLQTRRVSEMAKDSGATYFIVDKPAQLPAVYRTIATELNHQATILFYPAQSDDQQFWHPLKVEVEGLQIRAPRGYFP